MKTIVAADLVEQLLVASEAIFHAVEMFVEFVDVLGSIVVALCCFTIDVWVSWIEWSFDQGDTYVVLNDGRAVRARRRRMVILSSAAQEAVYIRKLCNELGFTQSSPTLLYEDCQDAVALSQNVKSISQSLQTYPAQVGLYL